MRRLYSPARWSTRAGLSSGFELDGRTVHKDVERDVSPYLVPWRDLPDNVRKCDRDTVRKILQFPAEVGIEMWRDKLASRRHALGNSTQWSHNDGRPDNHVYRGYL
jgi:hypothetical protein